METKITADKRLTIAGMSCGHCTARVEKALNQLDGVIAKVDLDGAYVSANRSVTNDMLIKQVEDAGYRVVSIQEA